MILSGTHGDNVNILVVIHWLTTNFELYCRTWRQLAEGNVEFFGKMRTSTFLYNLAASSLVIQL